MGVPRAKSNEKLDQGQEKKIDVQSIGGLGTRRKTTKHLATQVLLAGFLVARPIFHLTKTRRTTPNLKLILTGLGVRAEHKTGRRASGA